MTVKQIFSKGGGFWLFRVFRCPGTKVGLSRWGKVSPVPIFEADLLSDSDAHGSLSPNLKLLITSIILLPFCIFFLFFFPN